MNQKCIFIKNTRIETKIRKEAHLREKMRLPDTKTLRRDNLATYAGQSAENICRTRQDVETA